MKRLCITLCILFLSLSTGLAQKIRFSPQWTPQSQFAGYYAALENGYYAEVGLDVEIIHPTKSASSLKMLKDGETDIVASELIQAMMSPDEDMYLVNILQTTQHSTLVLISRKGDVNELSDLAGSRIGTWKIGLNEIPHMIDEEQNLEIEWIKVINPLNVYISGAVDGILAKTYNELIAFEMSGVTPGSVLKFADHGFDFPEDGVYVSEKYFKKNPERCRLFAEASIKGWEWVRNNPEAALEMVMKHVRENNITTNQYVQKWMLDAILKAQESDGEGQPTYKLDRDSFEKLNEALMSYGYISKPLDYERFTGGRL